jgi:uncharacterized protein (DUF1330 family)
VSAYVISEVEVLDQALIEDYRSLAASTVAKYDGRYLVRGGHIDAVEGEWPAGRMIVIVEFPSMQRAQQWYRSPEYAGALAIRQKALQRRLIFVEGVPAM